MSTGSAPFEKPPKCFHLNSGFCHRGTFWAAWGSQVCRRRLDAPWETWNADFPVSWLTPWNSGALAIGLPEERGISAAVFSGDGTIRRSHLALPRSEHRYVVSPGDGFVHIRERVPREGPTRRVEALLLPAPGGDVLFQPVFSPDDASALEAFVDADGEIAVLCNEGVYRPARVSREAAWKVRFGDDTVAAVLSANGLVLHDRWFVGSTVFGDTIVLDLETLRLRRSALPLRRNEARLLWSAWLSGRRPMTRRFLDACWRHPEVAPGERASAPDGSFAVRDGADGRLEILTRRGLLAVAAEPDRVRFDPAHPAAPLLCAWELHLREPDAKRWAMETLLVANDASELLPALWARMGRRIGSRLLRFVRGRPTESLLRGPLAAGKVWFFEGRQLATRTVQAIDGPDPAQALLATRGAPSLGFRLKPGVFAWRSPVWGAAMRALVHADPVVRQEAQLFGACVGPWPALRSIVPEEDRASPSFRNEMLRVVASEDPLGTRLGRLLAWSSWENASEAKYSGTALRFAPWDREASLFAGYVQARADAMPGREASSALVRCVEALGLEGFHAAFDGMLLGLLVKRAARKAARGLETEDPGSLPARLQPVLRSLAEWEGRSRRRPWKAMIGPGQATRRETALLALVLLLPELTPPLLSPMAEACRADVRRSLALGQGAEATLLASPPRVALVAKYILQDVVVRPETKDRLCIGTLIAQRETARPSLKGEGHPLPFHLRLAQIGTNVDTLERRAGQIAREPGLPGLLALLALADRGDADALGLARQKREELLRSARFLEDEGAIDMLLGLEGGTDSGHPSTMSP